MNVIRLNIGCCFSLFFLVLGCSNGFTNNHIGEETDMALVEDTLELDSGMHEIEYYLQDVPSGKVSDLYCSKILYADSSFYISIRHRIIAGNDTLKFINNGDEIRVLSLILNKICDNSDMKRIKYVDFFISDMDSESLNSLFFSDNIDKSHLKSAIERTKWVDSIKDALLEYGIYLDRIELDDIQFISQDESDSNHWEIDGRVVCFIKSNESSQF
ncbi:MAG: hypothetical protein J6S96_06810 [Muribaculaceae bacterium]|nr:hypothetical protein [Muribaculaceae bacterium]